MRGPRGASSGAGGRMRPALAQLVEEVRRKDERAEERLRMKDAEFDRERGRMMDAVKLLKDKQAEILEAYGLESLPGQ